MESYDWVLEILDRPIPWPTFDTGSVILKRWTVFVKLWRLWGVSQSIRRNPGACFHFLRVRLDVLHCTGKCESSGLSEGGLSRSIGYSCEVFLGLCLFTSILGSSCMIHAASSKWSFEYASRYFFSFVCLFHFLFLLPFFLSMTTFGFLSHFLYFFVSLFMFSF